MWEVYEQVDSAEDKYFASKFLVSTQEEAIYLAVKLRALNEGVEFGFYELKPLTPEQIEEVISLGGKW